MRMTDQIGSGARARAKSNKQALWVIGILVIMLLAVGIVVGVSMHREGVEQERVERQREVEQERVDRQRAERVRVIRLRLYKRAMYDRAVAARDASELEHGPAEDAE